MLTLGRRVAGVAFIALLTLIVTVALPAAAQSASITMKDQLATNGTLVVERVTIPQAGWIVVYKAGPDGKLLVSPNIGRVEIPGGTSREVVVRLAEEVAEGATLWAMLHIDEGVSGTFEFPGGPDSPIVIDGVPVMAEITVRDVPVEAPASDAAATPAATTPPTIMPHTAGEEGLVLPLLALALGMIALGGLTVSRATAQLV